MFTFFVQLLSTLQLRHLYFFSFYFLFTWFVWIIRISPSFWYRAIEPSKKRPSCSIIIPVCDEDYKIFSHVLNLVLTEKGSGDDILVAFNGKVDKALVDKCKKENIPYIEQESPSKREALVSAVTEVAKIKQDIIVVVDSDTLWRGPKFLDHLLAPFQNEEVGGVTPRQNILYPNQSLISLIADWQEELRNLFSFKSFSALGQIMCLPGRTIAFRKEPFLKNIDEFLSGSFLGTHLEFSDDREITNILLKEGYKTVYQSTAQIYTTAPTSIWRYAKQQIRWARGSQYNNLKMLPWYIRHKPFSAFFSIVDTLLPFLLLSVFINVVLNYLLSDTLPLTTDGTWLGDILIFILFASLGALVTFLIKNYKIIYKNPKQILFLPVFVIGMTFLIAPIRIYGFATMSLAKGWGTRESDYSQQPGNLILKLVPIFLAALLILALTLLANWIETVSFY